MRRELELAQNNFEALRTNPYPGRGIVIGTDDSGTNMVQIYWIMGRSENSQNRIFNQDGGRLFTEPADPTKVKDPSLIIYNAMNENRSRYVVSNGHQTDDVTEKIHRKQLSSILSTWHHEPDAPNWTPRITGVCSPFENGPSLELSILRRTFWGTRESVFYQYTEMVPGFGRGITTYSGDGDPLPSFEGEPRIMPLIGNADEILRTYWHALNPENRVSLAVKFIYGRSRTSEIYVINRFRKV
jgi:IMP cyclohydrolase